MVRLMRPTLNGEQLARMFILGAIDWRWLVAFIAITLFAVFVLKAKVE